MAVVVGTCACIHRQEVGSDLDAQSSRSNLVGSGLQLLSKAVSKFAAIPIFLEVSPESDILALELPVAVRNEEPGDETADEREAGADEEHGLRALEVIRKRILDRREDLRPVSFWPSPEQMTLRPT